MIKSFDHKGLEDFFDYGTKKGIQPTQAEKLRRILDRLDAANEIKDMNYPGSKLHKLNPKTTDATRQLWAVSVSGNWRIQFKFYDGNAYVVDYKDYH
jgi:toxin HigB-1